MPRRPSAAPCLPAAATAALALCHAGHALAQRPQPQQPPQGQQPAQAQQPQQQQQQQQQAPTAAQQAEARQRFERGNVLFARNNFEGALAEYQAAYDLSRRPSVLFNLGVTHQQLHHYPQAARLLEQYLREAGTIPQDRRAQIERALTEIRALIGYVTFAGVPEGAEIRVNGERVGTAPLAEPLALGSGTHRVDVIAPGYHDELVQVQIAGGQRREVTVAMRRVGDTAAMNALATLVVQDAPPGAVVEVDGRENPADRAIEVPPGPHNVTVRAPGYAPWSGQVLAPPGARRVATARLASVSGLGPVPFFFAAGCTVALGGVTTFFGLQTLATRERFGMLTRDDPEAARLAEEGARYRLITNVALIGTGVAAVVSVVLLTRTRFGARASMVDFGAAPRAEGGAEGAVRVRF